MDGAATLGAGLNENPLGHTSTLPEAPPQHVLDRGEPRRKDKARLELAGIEQISANALGHK
jgi:hypothetical protein